MELDILFHDITSDLIDIVFYILKVLLYVFLTIMLIKLIKLVFFTNINFSKTTDRAKIKANIGLLKIKTNNSHFLRNKINKEDDPSLLNTFSTTSLILDVTNDNSDCSHKHYNSGTVHDHNPTDHGTSNGGHDTTGSFDGGGDAGGF